MAKHVVVRPDWPESDHILDVFSVSRCLSEDFADYVNYWKHNGYWFFDSPEILQLLAREHSIDLTGTTLFFYEAYKLEFHDEDDSWTKYDFEPRFKTEGSLPVDSILEGFDVVTYSQGTTAECSPLSCNLLVKELGTNEHCLLSSFDRAKQLLEAGKFRNSEPGPFRIMAVHSVKWP